MIELQEDAEGYQPLSNSASGRWNLLIHVNHGMIEVSKITGSSLLDASGLSSSHFLLLTSGGIVHDISLSKFLNNSNTRNMKFHSNEMAIQVFIIR